MRKLSLIVEGGELAQEPESVFKALVAAAVADGADECDWVDRLLKAAGATGREVHVSERAQFQVIEEAAKEPESIFDRAMTLARAELSALLERSTREADTSRFKEQAKG